MEMETASISAQAKSGNNAIKTIAQVIKFRSDDDDDDDDAGVVWVTVLVCAKKSKSLCVRAVCVCGGQSRKRAIVGLNCCYFYAEKSAKY